MLDLPAHAGAFGALYWIPIIYVPILMITHCVAFYLLARRPSGQAAGNGAELEPRHSLHREYLKGQR
jgi:hypothetical protein